MPKLPDFTPPPTEELRELYRKHDDPDIRRLILEIVHLRQVLLNVEDFRKVIDSGWKETMGGELAGLYRLRIFLQAERIRAGHIS